MMGTPVYGYDWKLPFVQGQTHAQGLSPQAAEQRAGRYGVPIQYNTTYEAPFYNYTDAQGARHIVWFEDARSFQAKCNLVKQYNLRGMSFWQWPSPFPQVWPIMADNFTVRKVN